MELRSWRRGAEFLREWPNAGDKLLPFSAPQLWHLHHEGNYRALEMPGVEAGGGSNVPLRLIEASEMVQELSGFSLCSPAICSAQDGRSTLSLSFPREGRVQV